MQTRTTYFGLGFVAGILATLSILCGAISYFAYSVNEPCRQLEAISHDEVLGSNLWAQIANLIEKHAQMEDSDIVYGVRFAGEYEDGFGIDWKALNITLDVATIMMRGEGLVLEGFDPKLIDAVGVGYGYRYHLIFTIRDEPGSRSLDPSQWAYDLSVECRS